MRTSNVVSVNKVSESKYVEHAVTHLNEAVRCEMCDLNKRRQLSREQEVTWANKFQFIVNDELFAWCASYMRRVSNVWHILSNKLVNVLLVQISASFDCDTCSLREKANFPSNAVCYQDSTWNTIRAICGVSGVRWGEREGSQHVKYVVESIAMSSNIAVMNGDCLCMLFPPT